MAMERTQTVIVGGGQAGLVMSHMLARRGCPHLVLEQGRIGERWRSGRWDGLRFQFPNWSVRLPDFPFAHGDPEGFATGAEIVDFLDAYAAFVKAPVRCGVTVTRLGRAGDRTGFVLETSAGPLAADNVVVATGPYQRPVVPDLLRETDVFQVHASRYKAPAALPPGAVLVVGAGASGAQIAEELARAGRQVYLAVGRHRRMPRRYRGRDFMGWLSALGLDETAVESRGPDATLPLITGAYGGHTIDFRAFAAQGVSLLGRLQAGQSGTLAFAADLAENLARGDTAYLGFLDAVDAYIAKHRLDAPQEASARVMLPDPPAVADPPRRLDLRACNVGALVWATGYAHDFAWVDLPVFDARSQPIHGQGVTEVPGFYFLGLAWLSRMKSSFLAGVGDDAARLADHIGARAKGCFGRAAAKAG